MKILKISAMVLALGGAGTALAAEPVAEQGDGSRVVCFSEPKTGSHMRKRVCMTEAERDKRRAEDKEAMNSIKRGSSARGNANVEPALTR